MKREENQHRQPLQPIECLHKIVTRTSARSNVSVIPARVSGAREESRIPLEDGGEGPGFFARQPRARMTEQEIEQDQNCHYDLQRLNRSLAHLVAAYGNRLSLKIPRPRSGRGQAARRLRVFATA